MWVKRDDRTSRLYGGGKVRKLERWLASPRYAGDGPIVSIGGGQPSTCRRWRCFCASRVGRRTGDVDQVFTPHVRETPAAFASTGARAWLVRTRIGLPWAGLRYCLWTRPPRIGARMPAGGSNGVGGLGFVEAGLELGPAD